MSLKNSKKHKPSSTLMIETGSGSKGKASTKVSASIKNRDDKTTIVNFLRIVHVVSRPLFPC